jgi:DNA ligase-1
MSFDGEPEFTYWVIDRWDLPNMPYIGRRFKILPPSGARTITLCQKLIMNLDEMFSYEEEWLEKGYEGIILRDPNSPYKYGRSSPKEQYLVKRKPFVDEEAVIIGFEEQNENTNELTTNELGYAKRSGAKDGLVGKGTLGKFIVRSEKWGEFKIGTGLGLDNSLRQRIWDNQRSYDGCIIKFKYQPFGIKDKPRLPIYIGFRDKDDL